MVPKFHSKKTPKRRSRAMAATQCAHHTSGVRLRHSKAPPTDVIRPIRMTHDVNTWDDMQGIVRVVVSTEDPFVEAL
eukprot:m.745007 g.745007  ORF g.745007 m.745007 type:complete len:77 (+) comp23124_c0_seq51:1316-1546(+)